MTEIYEFPRHGRKRARPRRRTRNTRRRTARRRFRFALPRATHMLALILPTVVTFMAWRYESLAEAMAHVMSGRNYAAGASAARRIRVSGHPRVIYGDTLAIGRVRIRLHGMDAPERDQPCWNEQGRRWRCGARASRHLAHLIGGGLVTCEKVKTDRYGRMVAICRRGEMNLGRRMVRDGWAVAYIRYSRAYAREEARARREKRGIWRGYFTLPETWRHRGRS